MSFTRLENFTVTGKLTEKMVQWNHSDSIILQLGSRLVGFTFSLITSVIDAQFHSFVFVGKSLTGIVITPVNAFLKNPNLEEFELSSAFVHLIRAVQSLFQTAVLPFIILLDPEKAHALLPSNGENVQNEINQQELKRLKDQNALLSQQIAEFKNQGNTSTVPPAQPPPPPPPPPPSPPPPPPPRSPPTSKSTPKPIPVPPASENQVQKPNPEMPPATINIKDILSQGQKLKKVKKEVVSDSQEELFKKIKTIIPKESKDVHESLEKWDEDLSEDDLKEIHDRIKETDNQIKVMHRPTVFTPDPQQAHNKIDRFEYIVEATEDAIQITDKLISKHKERLNRASNNRAQLSGMKQDVENIISTLALLVGEENFGAPLNQEDIQSKMAESFLNIKIETLNIDALTEKYLYYKDLVLPAVQELMANLNKNASGIITQAVQTGQ